jgi:thiamine pyrophosphate-dependent acetolactate synthase large subunit-like protein
MADGFARASGQPGVVLLHATQGLLNAMGLIRVAFRDNVPIIIIVGLPSTTYDVFEPNHYTYNLEQILTPVTKWGWTLVNETVLDQVLIKLISTACAPSQGPVFLFVPQDIIERTYSLSESKIPLPQLSSFSINVVSDEIAIRVAKTFVNAQNPLIFAGFGARHNAYEIETLAELTSSPVISEALDRGTQVHNVYCRTNHPLFLSYYDKRELLLYEFLQTADVILFIGTKATYNKVIGELPANCKIIQVNERYEDLWKDHKVDIPVVGNYKNSLDRIIIQIKKELSSLELCKKIIARKEYISGIISNYKEKKTKKLNATKLIGESINGMQLIKSMVKILPENSIIIDDSQCMGYYLKHYFTFYKSNTLFGSMASHIGWGLPASLGVKEAFPEDPVICLTGDAGFLFGFQAIASASSYKIPVMIIVVNNRGFISLKKEMAIKGTLNPNTLQTLSLTNPPFSYHLMAKAFGIEGLYVKNPEHLGDELSIGLKIIQEKKEACVINVEMSDQWKIWDESWLV